jgi:hypothetical protein
MNTTFVQFLYVDYVSDIYPSVPLNLLGHTVEEPNYVLLLE